MRLKIIDYEKLEKDAKDVGIEKFVVGAILADNEKILLLERPKNDFMGGIYELPSGNLEQGETLEQGLIREIAEETGLEVKSVVDYVGFFDYKSSSGKKVRQFNFLVELVSKNPIILTEHDSYVWSLIDELDKYPVTDSVKEIVQNYRLKFL